MLPPIDKICKTIIVWFGLSRPHLLVVNIHVLSKMLTLNKNVTPLTDEL